MKINNLLYILSLIILLGSIYLAVEYQNSGRIQFIAGILTMIGFGSLLLFIRRAKKSGNWPVLFMGRLTAAQKRPPSPRDVLALKRKSSKRADSQLVHQRPPLVFQSVKKSIRALKDTKNFHFFFFAAASILSTPPSFGHWKAKPKPRHKKRGKCY